MLKISRSLKTELIFFLDHTWTNFSLKYYTMSEKSQCGCLVMCSTLCYSQYHFFFKIGSQNQKSKAPENNAKVNII